MTTEITNIGRWILHYSKLLFYIWPTKVNSSRHFQTSLDHWWENHLVIPMLSFWNCIVTYKLPKPPKIGPACLIKVWLLKSELFHRLLAVSFPQIPFLTFLIIFALLWTEMLINEDPVKPAEEQMHFKDKWPKEIESEIWRKANWNRH